MTDEPTPDRDAGAERRRARRRAAAAPLWMLWTATLNFLRDDGPQRAGHIAFVTLLALFPFIIFLTALAGFVGQSTAAADFVALALGSLPAEVAQAITPAIDEVLGRTRGGLLTLGLLAALWVASSGVEALRTALNRAYQVPRPRPIWQRRLQGVAFVVLAAGGIVLAMVGVVAGPVLWSLAASRLGVPPLYEAAWTVFRYAVGMGGMFAVLCAAYRWLPARRPPWRLVLPGAGVALAGWLAAAELFSQYLSHFGRFGVTYGSLGGIVIALVFFYVGAAITIFGAEYNAAFGGKKVVPPPPEPRPPRRPWWRRNR